jgi:hypothetical protein
MSAVANEPDLRPLVTPGAQVLRNGPDGWRLAIPPGPAGRYRLAQLDDYGRLRRGDFPHTPPLHFSVRARASGRQLPGTWGFGLWNNPFGLALLTGAEVLRLPALPNCAWFFFASPPNHLSLRDDLPGQGALAATFRSQGWPPALLAVGAPTLPLLFWRPAASRLRRLASRYVHQAVASLVLDPTEWHHYSLAWGPEQVIFTVDGRTVLETSVSPAGPLGLVMWVDNQYAALPPDGRLSFGSLPNQVEAWIELQDLRLLAG